RRIMTAVDQTIERNSVRLDLHGCPTSDHAPGSAGGPRKRLFRSGQARAFTVSCDTAATSVPHARSQSSKPRGRPGAVARHYDLRPADDLGHHVLRECRPTSRIARAKAVAVGYFSGIAARLEGAGWRWPPHQ